MTTPEDDRPRGIEPPPPVQPRALPPIVRPPLGQAGPHWGGDGAFSRNLDADMRARAAERAAIAARTFEPSPTARTEMVLPPGIELASFPRRMAAWTIDYLIKTLILEIVLIAAGITSTAFPPPAEVLIPAQLLSRGYDFIFFIQGRSPGAWMLGIRIARLEDSGEPGVGRALLRTFGAFLSETALFVGFVVALFSRRRQTWQDRIARTIVVTAIRPPRR